MSGHPALFRFALLASLIVPGSAFAQFPPPAGSAGAGASAINGIPYGPANPRSVGDPSGIGNASQTPPLPAGRIGTPSTIGAANPTSTRTSTVAPPYAGASQRLVVPRQAKSRRAPFRPRGRVYTSTFTGICRGC